MNEKNDKSSLIDSWMKEWNLVHLKEYLVKVNLYSIEKLKQFALKNNFEQEVAKMAAVIGKDILHLTHGCNALLMDHLGRTNDFLSKLKQSWQEDKIGNECEKKHEELMLILIDGDDIGMLLENKQISMAQVQNSINLLNASICRIIDNKNIFGYHLGSDLFALFVYDDKNTINKSVEIVEYLLSIMKNKNKSSFTISVGMDIRDTITINDNHGDAIQKQWVLQAHINLLRAKENGKNCYFNIQSDIDSSKDNKELTSLTAKINQLYDDLYIDECEILIDQVLKKFEQETIIDQTITTKNAKTMRSVYLIKALIIFLHKVKIGNNVYRVNRAKEWIKLSLKAFILGKMSIECYYYYKLLQMEIEKELEPKTTQNKTHCSNHIAKKYDLTLLTQKRRADDVISCVTKDTSLYYGKQAYEHASDISDACVAHILTKFADHVGELGKHRYKYQKKLYQQAIELDKDSSQSLCRINLANILWKKKKYKQALKFIENSIESFPNNSRLLHTAAVMYRDSCKNKDNGNDDDKRVMGLNKDKRLNKAIEYGKKMVNLAINEGQWISHMMYIFYGSLLYSLSKDFGKNKEQQVTAIKVYEKGTRMDQQFGYDIINNWIRDLDKFEHELVNIIVDYWYTPDKNMQKYILDCADLFETYFNQHESKMKRVKLLSSIAPRINVIIEDRVDFLMESSEAHDIIKGQIVGAVSLHFANKLMEDQTISLKLFNLPDIRIFNPGRVKETEDENIIKIKCIKNDESINFAKYKIKLDEPNEDCPLKLSLKYENIENDSIVVVTFHVQKHTNLANIAMYELKFLATVDMDNDNGKITHMIKSQPKTAQIDGCKFYWSDQMPQKFMFALTSMYQHNSQDM